MKKIIKVILTIFSAFIFIGINAAFLARETDNIDQNLKEFSLFDKSKDFKSINIKKIFNNIDQDRDLKIINFEVDKYSYLLGHDESLEFKAEISSNDTDVEIFSDKKSLGLMEVLNEEGKGNKLYSFTLDNEKIRELFYRKRQEVGEIKSDFYIKIGDKLSEKIEISFKEYKNIRSSIEGSVKTEFLNLEEVAIKLDRLKKGFEQEAIETLRSDKEGRFKIEDLPLGDYSITFAKDGYKIKTIQFFLGEDTKIINSELEQDQESIIEKKDRPQKYFDQASAIKLSNLINEYRKERGLFEKSFLLDEYYQKKAGLRAKKLKRSFYYGEGLDSLINKVWIPGLVHEGKSLEEKALDNWINQKWYYKDLGELLNEDPNNVMLIGIYVEDDLAYINYYSGRIESINDYISKEDIALESLDDDIDIIR